MTETSCERDAIEPAQRTRGVDRRPHRLLQQIRKDLGNAWGRMLLSKPDEMFQLANAAGGELPALPPDNADAYLRILLANYAIGRSAQPRTDPARKHLSARERAVLVLVANGQSNKRVAQTLRVTPETVKSHLKNAFVKLRAKTRAEAVARAAELGQLRQDFS